MRTRKGRRSGAAARQAGPDMSEPINVDLSDPVALVGAERPDPDLQAHIGRQLRAMYDTVVNQPVPDRFLELLNKLDEKTGGTKDKE